MSKEIAKRMENGWDYYDLLEFPRSPLVPKGLYGRHIPVPIARRVLGTRIIERTRPVGKWRDEDFFFCKTCAKIQTQTKTLDEFVDAATVGSISTLNPFRGAPGYSFFKCDKHDLLSATKAHSLMKLKMDTLVELVVRGYVGRIHYIRSTKTRPGVKIDEP